jgi:signal peptidase I
VAGLLAGLGPVVLVVLVVVVGLAAGAAVLRRRVAIVAVVGPSMQPALMTGDRVLVRRARIGELRRGQIVVIEVPDADGRWPAEPPRWPPRQRQWGRDQWMIKRVAAVPGDRRPAGMTRVAPDGAAMPPDGAAMPPDGAAVPPDGAAVPPDDTAVPPDGAAVPPDRFAVLGDNAANSLDSRKIGYIPAERLLGVMVRQLTPARSGQDVKLGPELLGVRVAELVENGQRPAPGEPRLP